MSASKNSGLHGEVVVNIIDRREAAYADAIRALAKYKFWMAGYHMAAWVKYNQLLKGTPWHQGNPFKLLVTVAQLMRGELDDAAPWEANLRRKASNSLLIDFGAVKVETRRTDQCPECGGSEVEGDSVDITERAAEQKCQCLVCGAVWVDQHQLTGHVLIESGNRDPDSREYAAQYAHAAGYPE